MNSPARVLDLVLAVTALAAGVCWAFVGSVVLTMGTASFNFVDTDAERAKLYGIFLLAILIAYLPPAMAGYWAGVSLRLWRSVIARLQQFAGVLAALSVAAPALAIWTFYSIATLRDA